MGSKHLEKTILNKIDELIEILIELSKHEEGYEKQIESCFEKTEEIIPLVLQLIGGNNSLVVPMLYQLIMEKLPDARIISSFGSLQEEVTRLLDQVKAKYDNHNNKTSNKDNDEKYEEMDTKTDGNSLYLELLKAFPGYEILSNYRMGGVFVDYFIPALKIALLTDSNKPSSVFNLYCQEKNIKLIQLPKEITKDYRKISRFVRQKQKNSRTFCDENRKVQ